MLKKYSYFNKGDSSIPNISSFKGLEFKVYNVNSISMDSDNIDKINVNVKNEFDDYKFFYITNRG